MTSEVIKGRVKGAGPELMKMAGEELKRVFGYELVELPRKKSTNAKGQTSC